MTPQTSSITPGSAGLARDNPLFDFVRTMLGANPAREDDSNPLPPGPWDPVIRTALTQAGLVRGLFLPDWNPAPRPEPWRLLLASLLARHPEAFDALGGITGPGDAVALNPQPLPPRYAFLGAFAQAVAERASLLDELAAALPGVVREGEQQGIIIVSGYIDRFVDAYAATGALLRWPYRTPRPAWFAPRLDAVDLVVMAIQFDSAAAQSHGAASRHSLAAAGRRFADAGLSRHC